MSDVFEGPGWWMASDGRWYPAEQHPDPAYRQRFVAPIDAPVLEQAVPGNIAATNGAPERTLGDASYTETRTERRVEEPEHILAQGVAADSAVVGNGIAEGVASERPVAETTRVDTHKPELYEAVAHEPEVDVVDTQAPDAGSDADLSDADWIDHHVARVDAPINTPTTQDPIRVGPAPTPEKQEERPVFAPRLPPSVTTAPDAHPDVQIELGRSAANDQAAATVDFSARAIRDTTPAISTALVVVEREDPYRPATVRGRIAAALVFLAGIGMIVGTFLVWTTGENPETGWDRGDGIATVLAGIVGSAAAGPIFVGYRHVIPKAIAIIAGLVGLVVAGIALIATLDGDTGSSVGVGVGLIVLAGSAGAMLLAGIADPGAHEV